MSDITIRQLTESDAEAYRAIRLEMLKRHPDSFATSYEDSIQEELEFFLGMILNSQIYGAFFNGNLIAVSGIYNKEGKNVCHAAAVWGVYVKPEHRNKRLSQTLIEKSIAELDENIEQVFISASSENTGALKIYNDLGFKEYGRAPKSRKYQDQYFDDVNMVKFLDQNT